MERDLAGINFAASLNLVHSTGLNKWVGYFLHFLPNPPLQQPGELWIKRLQVGGDCPGLLLSGALCVHAIPAICQHYWSNILLENIVSRGSCLIKQMLKFYVSRFQLQQSPGT